MDVPNPYQGLDRKRNSQKEKRLLYQEEALQWELDFINQANGSLGMSFIDFIELYLKDMEKRLKPSTVANKRFLIDLKIIPYRLVLLNSRMLLGPGEKVVAQAYAASCK